MRQSCRRSPSRTSPPARRPGRRRRDRKSTRLNSSDRCISYAVFCLKKNQQVGEVINEVVVEMDATSLVGGGAVEADKNRRGVQKNALILNVDHDVIGVSHQLAVKIW